MLHGAAIAGIFLSDHDNAEQAEVCIPNGGHREQRVIDRA